MIGVSEVSENQTGDSGLCGNLTRFPAGTVPCVACQHGVADAEGFVYQQVGSLRRFDDFGLYRVSPENTTALPSHSTRQPEAPVIWSAGKCQAVVLGPSSMAWPGGEGFQ